MEETLTKEFWDQLEKQYPLGIKVFTDWIDEYAIRIGWPDVFNEITNPRYRHLPDALKIGIWIEFTVERGGCGWEIEDMFTQDWNEDITESMKMFQEERELALELNHRPSM